MVRRLPYALIFLIFAIFVTLLAPSLAPAAGVQALFDLNTPSGGPFPSDRFTVPDEARTPGSG